LTFFLSLLWAAYLAFLSSTALFFVRECGMSNFIYTFSLSSLLGVYVIASLLCNVAIKHYNIAFVKKWGAWSAFLGLVFLGLTMFFAPYNAYLLTLAALPFYFSISWLQTPYFEETMNRFPQNRGVTACLLNSLRMMITAFFFSLSAKAYNGTVYPIVLTLITLASVALLIRLFYERYQRYHAKDVKIISFSSSEEQDPKKMHDVPKDDNVTPAL